MNKNLIEMFESSALLRMKKPCFRYYEKGQLKSLTWSEVRRLVQAVAYGLHELGVAPKDRVCILSKTRVEWTLADLGALAVQAVVVPIYESNTPEQAQYILQHSGAEILFVEDSAQLQKIVEVKASLPQLKHIILMQGDFLLEAKAVLGWKLWRFYEFCDQKNFHEQIYQQAIQKITPEQWASIVYTSGTTGPPKGVILTHGNFLAEVQGAAQRFSFHDEMESLVFLPFAHILARVVQFFQLHSGYVQTYAESIDRLLENIEQVRPHFMASVPRIFEKIYSKSLQGASASQGKQMIFDWAMAVGLEQCARQKGSSQQKYDSSFYASGYASGCASGIQKLKHFYADQLVFSKLKKRLGGRMQFFISGGAPLSIDVAQFFETFGIPIYEGYGLTETTAALTVNHPHASRLGTVGKVLEGNEIRIASDGEILVRGPLVFHGYYQDDEATKQAFLEGEWFATGDVGECDEDGFLKITDRKKDLIVTAAGKNIAPQNIENIVKTDPLISQCVVLGDRKKYLVALVTLDPDHLRTLAQSVGLGHRSLKELVEEDHVQKWVAERIAKVNAGLARFETIKKFAILPKDFTIDSGELTPSLKVKRKVVEHRYQEIIAKLYHEEY